MTQVTPTARALEYHAAVMRCGGNKAQAARELGVSRGAVQHLLKKYGLQCGNRRHTREEVLASYDRLGENLEETCYELGMTAKAVRSHLRNAGRVSRCLMRPYKLWTISIDPELIVAVKASAEARGITIRAWMENAIELELMWGLGLAEPSK